MPKKKKIRDAERRERKRGSYGREKVRLTLFQAPSMLLRALLEAALSSLVPELLDVLRRDGCISSTRLPAPPLPT